MRNGEWGMKESDPLRLVMMGTGSFAVPTFRAIWNCPSDSACWLFSHGPSGQCTRTTRRGRIRFDACSGGRVQRAGVCAAEHQLAGGSMRSYGVGGRSACGLRLWADSVARDTGGGAVGGDQPAWFAVAEVSRRRADQLGDLPGRARNRRDRDSYDAEAGRGAVYRPEQRRSDPTRRRSIWSRGWRSLASHRRCWRRSRCWPRDVRRPASFRIRLRQRKRHGLKSRTG